MNIRLKKMEQIAAQKMAHCGIVCMRISLAVVFIWFGILKPLGLSPAEELLKSTVSYLPFFQPDSWLFIIGLWEVVIGILFLIDKTVRLAIPLLFLHMVGTFLPLFVLPDVTFQQNGGIYLLSMEGQYIVKNIVIISGALIIGGAILTKEHTEALA